MAWVHVPTAKAACAEDAAHAGTAPPSPGEEQYLLPSLTLQQDGGVPPLCPAMRHAHTVPVAALLPKHIRSC